MVSMEERTSRLEGAFEQFSVVVHNMVTKDELQVSIEKLRAEMRAEIRAAELRITRWTVGSIFAASAIIIAAMKLLP